MIKTGIIGATGYTGLELVRILHAHPDVSIDFLSSESNYGKYYAEVFPFLEGKVDHYLYKMEQVTEKKLDAVFLGLPHGVSMDFVKKYDKQGFVIIDISGDFRITPVHIYEKWYHKSHVYPAGLNEAVYGLPELYRNEIKDAKLIANPGCFSTGALMTMLPLLEREIIDESNIIIDSKTGVSGAGVKPKDSTHFPAVNNNFKAYGVTTHRHIPEMENIISRHTGKSININFIPHLLPVDRGIFTTAYFKLNRIMAEEEMYQLYHSFYAGHPFIHLTRSLPSLKDVVGTNYCHLYLKINQRTGHLIVISVLDNLMKGASGQAVQNLNIAFGLNEEKALNSLPLNP